MRTTGSRPLADAAAPRERVGIDTKCEADRKNFWLNSSQTGYLHNSGNSLSMRNFATLHPFFLLSLTP
ncbi:hypothetical protein FQN60_014493 [Etheostoma spectabile]|uniref:Uncharacterized protein n=1 Tax=Etheostoma spectabile TaxID=54343 RepID=A0A5J5DAI3_9PERO|nr:hypothetical protein FQN60_014493 [Etheostoma spectabile]